MTDIEDLFADLPPVPAKFYVCPDHPGGQVQWVGKLAYCLTCGRTNAVSEFLTTAELDVLPEGTAVIDRDRDILTKRPDGLWGSYEMAPMSSVKVAKWRPRLATADEVTAKREAIAAAERARKQRHTWECMNRTRIGLPSLDACNCPIDGEEAQS